MSGAQFEVSGQPCTDSCKIKLNGEEIQRSLSGLTIRGDASDPTFDVELRVRVFEDLRFETQWANVTIPNETRDLLIKLGWTPPAE